jgi:hypothetical protein
MLLWSVLELEPRTREKTTVSNLTNRCSQEGQHKGRARYWEGETFELTEGCHAAQASPVLPLFSRQSL